MKHYYIKPYERKKKCSDYSRLFPELSIKYNDNGKEMSMYRAMALGKISREEMRNEVLTLVG